MTETLTRAQQDRRQRKATRRRCLERDRAINSAKNVREKMEADERRNAKPYPLAVPIDVGMEAWLDKRANRLEVFA